MTIRYSSPPSKPSARRAKHATSDSAFKLDMSKVKASEAYKWCYHWFWYIDLLTLEWQAVVAEASGNPAHWFHTSSSTDLTQRFLARVFEKADREQWVPFVE